MPRNFDSDRLAIRVFISSTFRDMFEGREILLKQVFPQLRRLCEERGVTWSEVDLRWGIPEEAAAEGQVLPICLAEIDRCRPYFIGLLGERYGWVPDSIPADLVATRPWLVGARGLSVSEIEILSGVLQSTGPQPKAFFYFRDPAFVNASPPSTGLAAFRDQSEMAARKQADLKRRIRQHCREASHILRENVIVQGVTPLR